MKKFLTRILIFFIAFFVIEKGVWFLLEQTPHRQYDKRLEMLLKGQINKDIIVLGSSRGAGNILAGQLEKETGMSAYNLSYQGANINFQHFIFKTLLNFNKKPKCVFITIDNSSQFANVGSLKYRKDALQPLTKYNYINSQLVEQGVNNILSHVFFLGRLNSTHFKKEVFVPSLNPLDAYGTMAITKNKSKDLEYSEIGKPYDRTFEKNEKIEAFKGIQNICASKNINLVFVFCPNFGVFNKSFYQRFTEMVQPENHVFVYDSLNEAYSNKKYFYDESHLTKQGATIFTSELVRFLNGIRLTTE
ncbi:hypothetical protein [Tamlana crocina]|uniref:DUF1574 domain-containing protein n=1 Tax=Tamlana crocina TaxID=393006 RepID=A0ABX1D9J4_9FLAO|nr:hypothetical protein [Tamlana crocina]NJX15045.1 hypothetical protein [Tamlana crocina]